MKHKLKARARAQSLYDAFLQRGAQAVDSDVFQDAALLLDLYGEDIRARAYLVMDPVHGEQMLRPDFTVPVTQMHMTSGAAPAQYTYMGEVFRRQEDHPERRNAYFQVGYEIFEMEHPARADAEVFCAMKEAIGPIKVDIATSDINVIIAGVHGLKTTAARTDALLRHVWRPKRFRALLKRYAWPQNIPQERRAMLSVHQDPENVIGLRSVALINERLESLRQDFEAPALSAEALEIVDRLLEIKGSSTHALSSLTDLSSHMPELRQAADRLEARLEALEARGIMAGDLPYEQSYGRTTMEYYDGFVFGFFLPNAPEEPPLVTGGRYDALTSRLGQGQRIPAVGAVIRPDVLVDWQEDQDA